MLNKQGPGKIDWCDYSFNPISGKCFHNCHYCYMHSIWKRFPEHAKTRLKENYLKIKLPKKPSKIFVGSSTDMWGTWIPDVWIQEVLDFVEDNPKHTFQFLTKNPQRYCEFELPENGWYGTTVDGTIKTLDNLDLLNRYIPDSRIKFVSFEPLIETPKISSKFYNLDWIIIGADSSKGATKPPQSWADFLIQEARKYNIPVFVKDNYGYPERLKEFPED